MAPKYTQPKAPIPVEWPEGPAYKETQPTPDLPTALQLSPEEFLQDARLQEVVQMALSTNLDLRLAVLNVEEVRAFYGIQRAELYPRVGALVTGNRQHSSSDFVGPDDPRTTNRYSLGLGVAAWEIDSFGRIRSLKNQALEQYLAMDQFRRSAQILLVSEVARAYFTLAADRKNLTLAQSTFETQTAVYDLIQTLLKNGLSTELDLRRAQSQVDAAQGDVHLFTQLVAQDENALTLLVGAPVPDKLLPADLESVTPPKQISPGLSSEVLLNRPDIVAAEHQLKAAYANIGAARAALFPRISLTALVGTANGAVSSLFGSGTGTGIFGLQAAIPIFDARTWAALRVTEADREIALTQYEKAIQTAFREVADTLAVHGTVGKQIAAHQSLLEATSKTLRLSEIRYTNGIDSYLSVLDAQRSLYSAQQGLVSLRLSKLVNQVRLYAVLGGGGF